jgi:hypothetical protein
VKRREASRSSVARRLRGHSQRVRSDANVILLRADEVIE